MAFENTKFVHPHLRKFLDIYKRSFESHKKRKYFFKKKITVM